MEGTGTGYAAVAVRRRENNVKKHALATPARRLIPRTIQVVGERVGAGKRIDGTGSWVAAKAARRASERRVSRAVYEEAAWKEG